MGYLSHCVCTPILVPIQAGLVLRHGNSCWFILCRRQFNKSHRYDTTASDDEASVLEIKGVWRTLSLSLLPSPLKQELVPVRVPSDSNRSVCKPFEFYRNAILKPLSIK